MENDDLKTENETLKQRVNYIIFIVIKYNYI